MIDMPKSAQKYYKAWISHIPESFQAWTLFYIFLHIKRYESVFDSQEWWLFEKRRLGLE